MVDDVIPINVDNVHIVDIPAGSGKTYQIGHQINEFLLKNADSQVLAITFTNRATEEMKKNIDDSLAYISTIHSFINDLIGPLFKNKSVIDLYLMKYQSEIIEKINDRKK